MRSLERRFKNIEEKNAYWSTFLCFAEAVKEQCFGNQAIRLWFNKLVDPDDYAKEGKKELLFFLFSLSLPLRTHRNKGQSPDRAEIQDGGYIVSSSRDRNEVSNKEL